MSKIKLVFFDMEGTLFKKLYKDSKGNVAPSAWRLISEHLGEEATKKDDELMDKWNDGGYQTYLHWSKEALANHQTYGLTKDFFEHIMNSIEFNQGVQETFEILRNKGYITALITGGFKAQADRAQRLLKIDHAFAACEYFWNETGHMEYYNLLPCDYEGKVDFMKLLMKEYGLKPENCAFVGDGVNDVHLAKEVGLSIAFNGAKKLQEVSTHAINQEDEKIDFKAIMSYL